MNVNNINMKISKVNKVNWKDVGLDYDICREIYEDGCGKDIEGRYLDVEFLNIMFDDRLEWEEDEIKDREIERMFENISKLDGDLLIEF